MQHLTTPPPPAPSTKDAPELAPDLRARILIEAAMEQSQRSDAELITRQLAAELNQQGASLSDVRVAVQSLYQGDLAAAEAYLKYLAKNGFPKAPVPSNNKSQTPSHQSAAQTQAIAQHSPAHYGQLPEPAKNNSAQAEAFNRIALYSGNLISELVANSAYSALVFGDRRSGTSAILRAILYNQIAKAGETLLDILDFHNGEWGGLEQVQLEDGSRLVTHCAISGYDDIQPACQKLATLAAEVKRRQHAQRAHPPPLSGQPEALLPYLFLIDGLSEIRGALPGWSPDRCRKDKVLSRSASHLRFVLCHGPAVNVSCVATARDHNRCLCDTTALGETKLLFLGRVSPGRNGGYRAIDRAVEDRDLLPSPHDRSRYRDALSAVKKLACPVVFTPNGIPRLGHLGNFSGYLTQDLLMHYQHCLEVSAG